ncbi:MAG: hypothetical protein OXE94_05780 [Aestuariivita sp.]|nr:hypothetical protein [Aestuariivita sp.]MCY4203643.1 hypothetical protein [Aestuariivita sp.]
MAIANPNTANPARDQIHQGDTEYGLATALTNRRYTMQALSHRYLERCSIADRYLTHKNLFAVFRSQSERGVRQERYASFVPIAFTRIVTNRCEHDINGVLTGDRAPNRRNFKLRCGWLAKKLRPCCCIIRKQSLLLLHGL